MPAAVMREDDQRVDAGSGCGIADSQLLLLSAVQPGRKVVLGFWIEVLACVLRCCRIPDFAWEFAVPCHIQRANRTHANRKSTADERIISHLNYAVFLNWLSASSSAP
jgi:hypothetical protein